MLRRVIKAIIPSKSDVFFHLFIDGAKYAHDSANLLAEIITAIDAEAATQTAGELRIQRSKALQVNQDLLEQLNQQFITPIDRGEIQYLSMSLLKLTKRIIKINRKLTVYQIDGHTDDCLIRSVNTLQSITNILVNVMQNLANADHHGIMTEAQKADELDENVVEDLGHAFNEIALQNYDALTIIKLKEVYKAIENAIDTAATLCDAVMRISVKEI